MKLLITIFAFASSIIASTIPARLSLVPRQLNLTSRCENSTFQAPNVPGVDILSISAAIVNNFSFADYETGSIYTSQQPLCTVNVTYTHPGYNDTIHVYHYLPISNWNGRFMGIGGGGFLGTYLSTGAIHAFEHGFAAAGTDTGHGTYQPVYGMDPSSWAQTSPFNVNYNNLVDFATKALGDLPQIAKPIIENFYGQSPSYSYFEGCSGGGRQAAQLAQAFPSAWDGIIGASPALEWSRAFASFLYPPLVMQELSYAPSICELTAFLNASITACDEIDGVKDGVVADPLICPYDPYELVGTTVQCSDNTSVTITSQAAAVQAEIWKGAVDVDGKFIWFANSKGAAPDLVANTTLLPNGTRVPSFELLGVNWYRYFVTKNVSFDLTTLNYTSFAELSLDAVREFGSIIDASNPDLSQLQKAGSKFIVLMGAVDEILPTAGVISYYDTVRALQPNIADNFRLFVTPGMGHCSATTTGNGYFPDDYALEQIMAWVEKGVAPDFITATSAMTGWQRPVCAYPKVARWNGYGNQSLASSYECADNY